MLTLKRGRVSAVVSRADGLARLEVDGLPCIAYPRLTGPVVLGDDVLVNVQARELELGSGGFDVLYANMTRGLDLAVESGAHVVKLPYTPVQAAALHAEEGRELPETLAGLPVVCCSLHSQVAPVCAGIGSGRRVAYVQFPGGGLPVSLSDTLRVLRARGLLETTVAVDACFDGDVQCVSVASALLWCAAEGFDVVVCAIGPGVVGTGSSFGHGGVAAAWAALAARALGGEPILAVRASQADPRQRHRGISHHSRDVLRLAGGVTAAWPRGFDPPDGVEVRLVDVDGWEDACDDLPLSHMGRGPGDDPLFFAAAFAAGRAT
ncbi:MAG TPA: DUF3866 family protein [Gaiellaceae bacterium]|nr:DUF3866 family protein [Gaiellaceae bacterium]